MLIERQRKQMCWCAESRNTIPLLTDGLILQDTVHRKLQPLSRIAFSTTWSSCNFLSGAIRSSPESYHYSAATGAEDTSADILVRCGLSIFRGRVIPPFSTRGIRPSSTGREQGGLIEYVTALLLSRGRADGMKRAIAPLRYSSSSSQHIHLRPSTSATAPVTQEPAKGSSTRSPGSVRNRRKYSGSCAG